MLYSHIHIYVYKYKQKHNQTLIYELQWTNTVLYKNISLTLYSQKGDVCCVWEMSWRQGQTAILTQTFSLDHSSTSSSSWLGSLTVGHWRSQSPLLLALTLASCLQLNLNRLGTWLYYCLTSTCFHCSSAYLYWCISWLTAQSRVNI